MPQTLDERSREFASVLESFGEFWRKGRVWTRKNGHGFDVSACGGWSCGFSGVVFAGARVGRQWTAEQWTVDMGRGGVRAMVVSL